MKSGNLNFLEPSGPLQAFNGTALPFFKGGLKKYRGAGKSLARPGRKQARKHVRDARTFNKIEKRAVIKFLFLHGKAPKENHAILTETLASFLPGRAKDLPAPL
jgi:hypothetical protein